MCHLLWAFSGAYYEQNGGAVASVPRELVKVVEVCVSCLCTCTYLLLLHLPIVLFCVNMQ